MKNRVKQLREERNISQLNLAVRIGSSQQTISKLEKGGIPRADVIVNIAKFFNVSLEYLLCLSENKRVLENQIAANQLLEHYYDFLVDFHELNRANQETVEVLIKHLLLLVIFLHFLILLIFLN